MNRVLWFLHKENETISSDLNQLAMTLRPVKDPKR